MTRYGIESKKKTKTEEKHIAVSQSESSNCMCIVGSQITHTTSIWITSMILDQNNYCTPFSSISILLHPFSFWMEMESNVWEEKLQNSAHNGLLCLSIPCSFYCYFKQALKYDRLFSFSVPFWLAKENLWFRTVEWFGNESWCWEPVTLQGSPVSQISKSI